MPDLRKEPGGRTRIHPTQSQTQRAIKRRMRAAWSVKGKDAHGRSVVAHCYMCDGAHPWGEPCDGRKAAIRNIGQHLKRSR